MDNKYGQVAVKAARMLIKYPGTPPEEAWSKATKEIFFDSSSSQTKSCPKATFLGLCEEGYVQGVQKGKYTKSTKNKNYVLRIVEFIKVHPMNEYDKEELWSYATRVETSPLKQNQQIEVVLALKDANLLNI
jgi:hypothetical protein